MKVALNPYPQYQAVDLPWLQQVPAHWSVKRGKALFRRIDERSSSGREELLTVSSVRGVVPRSTANVTMFKAESYEGYKLCWPDDLVINSLWAWAGGLGVSRYHGIISSAYGVYRLREGSGNSPAFIHNLVRSAPFQWELQVRSKGIWTSRLQLTDQSFLSAPFPVPPPDEQAAIVRFLGYADSRVQRYIRAKQGLIKLLDEQKRVIVDQAVTGQIDVLTGNPYPAYKDSGVKSLGSIPEHWSVRRLAAMGRLFKGNGGTKEDETTTGVPCVRYGDIYMHHRFFVRETRSYISEERASDYTPIQYGDILFAGSGETIDEIGKSVVCLLEPPACCGGDVILFRPSIEVDALFMGYAADSTQAVFQKSCMGRGITVMHIYGDQLRNLWLALPPVHEQVRVSRYLDEALADIEATIERTNREIGLLREYRPSLIADVVTGRLDVRELAAQLPEEGETELTQDGSLFAGDEIGELDDEEVVLEEVER